jgi:RNA polymerase-binding transcription factor DksA
MDKKRLDYYKKKLVTRREELARGILRTEQEGREADEDPTVDLADKAANSYTKEVCSYALRLMLWRRSWRRRRADSATNHF